RNGLPRPNRDFRGHRDQRRAARSHQDQGHLADVPRSAEAAQNPIDPAGRRREGVRGHHHHRRGSAGHLTMSNAKTSHIVQSQLVNVAIALAKAVAAALTGSGALLAEAIHSSADCTNQVLLLVGVRAASKPPTREYPLGRGREVYFWSFLVALLLFS